MPLETTKHNLILPILGNNSGESTCCSSVNPAILDKDKEILSSTKSSG